MSIVQHLKEHMMLGGVSGLAGGLSGAPRTLLACGTPVGIAPTGTMAANGAVTLGTALAVIYTSGLWLYFAGGAVYAGSAAGFYWCVMSSTTVGTVYNNIYVPGTNSFDAPASPTAVVAAGPGAFTGVTSEITTHSVVIPGGLMTRDSELQIYFYNSYTNSAGSKYYRARVNTAEFLRKTYSTTASGRGLARIPMVGVSQAAFFWNTTDLETATALSLGYLNAGSDMALALSLQCAVATDNIVTLGNRAVVLLG